MQNLIPFINKLQEIFSAAGVQFRFNLPQIVVLGEQSTGKSSVLENFVGRDFLPRGSGIVTRRPLVLQLHHVTGTEYAVFGHRPEHFYDYNRIREEIELDTVRVAGSKKSISPIPIFLKIFSQNVVDITLVDLPGLTKIAIEDQPADIDKQIKNMIYNYISNPNALILAVIPANIDLAVSDALKTAREVDATGDRTIGVITKIDMMDETTNCMDILLNRLYPLKRGYIGVVNRSQKDIEHRRNIYDAQQAEMNFFLSHPIYKNHAHKLGSVYLQNFLNQQLKQHIVDKLPSLRRDLEEKFKLFAEQMKEFQYDTADDKPSKMKLLMQMLSRYSKDINRSLGFQLDDEVDMATVSRGARINKLIFENLPYHFRKGQNITCDDDFRNEVKIAIMNTTGIRSGSLSSSCDLAFITAVKKKIITLRPLLIQTITRTTEELKRCVVEISNNLSHYPRLKEELLRITIAKLDEFEEEAKRQINIGINMELSFINIKHPDFVQVVEQFISPCSKPSVVDEDLLASRKENSNNNTGVIAKGYMTNSASSFFSSKKDMYFILDNHVFQWFKDEFDKQPKCTLSLKTIHVRESTVSKNKNGFTLFRKDGNFLYKDVKTIEITPSNDSDFMEWKSAFRLCGIFEEVRLDTSSMHKVDVNVEDDESSKSFNSSEIFEIDNSDITVSVEKIAKLVSCYLSIVRKNQCDYVAKTIMYFLIDKLRNFLSSEITASLLTSNSNTDALLGMSKEHLEKQAEVVKNYRALEDGLRVLKQYISSPETIETERRSNSPTIMTPVEKELKSTVFPRMPIPSSAKRPLPPRKTSYTSNDSIASPSFES